MKENTLRQLKAKLEELGAKLLLKDKEINVKIGASGNVSFKDLRPLLYYLLNTYEDFYFITIEDLPYCLMPDAQEHIVYKRNKKISYVKFSACKSCKCHLLCPGWIKDRLKSKPAIEPILDLPGEVVIEVNKRCNLRCVFCFSYSKNLPVPSRKIRKIIDETKRLKIKYIRFTGGEPLLRSDIMDLLNYSKSQGFYVFLNTNGTLLDDRIIKRLEKCVDNVLISLQGHNPQTENKISRRGDLLSIKFKGIAKLQKSKIRIVRIGTVASKFLLNNLSKYYLLIKRLGIKRWELYRPMISKSLAGNHPQFNFTNQDFLKLMKFIQGLKEGGLMVSVANAVPFCITEDKNLARRTLLGTRFDDGHSRLIFDARGYFKPSYNIDKNLGETIEEAWNHPFMKKIRRLKYLPQLCQDCTHLKWCLGGSRYLAKESYGDYFASDPWMTSQYAK